MEEDLMKMDLYDILEIRSDSDVKTIKTAYRKKALKCHPDKNPDDPNAAKLFDQLKKILEVLTDERKRATYNQLLRSKEAARLRHEQLDSRCKKFKSDLERREKEADLQNKQDQEKEKIERLRRDAAVEIDKYTRECRKANLQQQKESSDSRKRIHIRWKAEKKDANNGGYNEDNLKKIFLKYGDIEALVMSPKNGSALIEFYSTDAVRRAAMTELGYPSNPLKIRLLGETITTKLTTELNSFIVGNVDTFEASVLRAMKEAQAKKNNCKSSKNDGSSFQ